MMESGQDRNGDDASGPLDYSAEWRIILERQMSAYLVVVGGIRSEDPLQMPGTDNQHVI
jgi:hypothetical protein